jgi:hypothetical protein
VATPGPGEYQEGVTELLAISTRDLASYALAFFASLAASILIVVFLVVRMPEDWFASKRRPLPPGPKWLALFTLVLKNLVGLALIAIGLVMSLPGFPGQGVLTILVGVVLVDGPGKRRFELAMVRRPAIRRTLDRIRRKFGKPPLRVMGDPGDLG